MLQHSIDSLGRGDRHVENSGRGNLAPLQWRKRLRHTTSQGNRAVALIGIMRDRVHTITKIARNIISWCEACELRGSVPGRDWVVENRAEKRHLTDNEWE